MDWFRLHHGTPQDPKWIVVSRRARVPVGAVLSVWMTMLDAASRASERGTLEGWDHEDVAAMLGYETEQVAAIYDAMQGKTLDGDRVMAWDKRQPKRERDDDSASRVRAHRERNAAEDHVTPCNASGSQETPRGEEKREEKKEEAQKASPSSPRAKAGRDPMGTRLPDEWGLSEELFEWSTAEARAPPKLIEAEVPRFRDYWRAKPGKDGRKRDWDATWRNWLRNAMERAGHGGRNGSGSQQRSYLDGVREFARTAGTGAGHSAEDGLPG